MSNNKKQAQWETGEIDTYVDEFLKKVIPEQKLPISNRSLSTEPSNKNMNRTNPFKENGEAIHSDGDDQVQLQQTFNDMGGYLPVMASRKRKLRMALFDAQQYPAGMDIPQMGDVTEVNQLDSFNKEMQPKRDWEGQQTNTRDKAMREYIRNKGPQDQIPEGLIDLTREGGDGENI